MRKDNGPKFMDIKSLENVQNIGVGIAQGMSSNPFPKKKQTRRK